MEKEVKSLKYNRNGKSRIRGWLFGTDFGDYRNGGGGTEIGAPKMGSKNRTLGPSESKASCAGGGRELLVFDEAEEISKEAWETLRTRDSSRTQHFVFPQVVRLNAGRSKRPW